MPDGAGGPQAGRPEALDALSWPARGGRPRALVVLCHGAAASARQMHDLAAAWGEAVPDAAFLAPHAPRARTSRHPYLLPLGRLRRREWFSLRDRSPAVEAAGLRAAAAALDRTIEAALEALDLGEDRLVLAGFSQGAMMALFAGQRRAVAPLGLLSFAGGVPALPLLAGELRNQAPVLLVHGEADPIVPVARSRDSAQALRGLGVPVQLLALPEVGHEIDLAGLYAGCAFLRRVLE
jgi:phospholipase/carboxylesterase